MKRSLQITLVILSLLPLGVGGLSFIFGAALFLPDGVATPKLDSQFRFVSAWDIGLTCLVWWIVPRIDEQTALFRFLCIAVFVGGLGRVMAWYTTGSPGVALLAVMFIELLVPALIPWQMRVAREAQRTK